jgi:hypothetical protein
MNKLTSALAAVLVLGSASLALADDLATDQAADAVRSYGPAVTHQGPLTSKNVALPRNVQTNSSSWMDRASQTFSGGY